MREEFAFSSDCRTMDCSTSHKQQQQQQKEQHRRRQQQHVTFEPSKHTPLVTASHDGVLHATLHIYI